MKDKLSIALIQSDLYWENTVANLAMFEEKIAGLEAETDVILLPEMFNTGFSMQAEKLAEPMNLTTFKWLKQQAARTKALIMGSFIVKEDGNYFNRLIAMQPDGSFQHYDKRHLFRMAGEDRHFSFGDKKIIVHWKGWKLCPLVCYDLRFPVWGRNRQLAYDCLLFVANWPAARISAWDALLTARAIENLSYCVGLNRVGKDGNGIAFNGHSAVYNAKGEAILPPFEVEETVLFALESQPLLKLREKFPAHLDADDFEVEL